MEGELLKYLNLELSNPTPKTFLRYIGVVMVVIGAFL